jgi:hypothetical protein
MIGSSKLDGSLAAPYSRGHAERRRRPALSHRSGRLGSPRRSAVEARRLMRYGCRRWCILREGAGHCRVVVYEQAVGAVCFASRPQRASGRPGGLAVSLAENHERCLRARQQPDLGLRVDPGDQPPVLVDAARASAAASWVLPTPHAGHRPHDHKRSRPHLLQRR